MLGRSRIGATYCSDRSGCDADGPADWLAVLIVDLLVPLSPVSKGYTGAGHQRKASARRDRRGRMLTGLNGAAQVGSGVRRYGMRVRGLGQQQVSAAGQGGYGGAGAGIPGVGQHGSAGGSAAGRHWAHGAAAASC
jgi:hypothetical protein